MLPRQALLCFLLEEDRPHLGVWRLQLCLSTSQGAEGEDVSGKNEINPLFVYF